MSVPAKIRPVWQEAQVVEHRHEAEGTAGIVLKLEMPMSFLPGQYVNLRLRFPDRDKPVQRSYSIASPPDITQDALEVIVTKVPGGLVSTKLVDELSVGDTIDVRGPYGKFTWVSGDPSPVLMIAAGSGVVPFLSMLEYMSREGVRDEATLLLSARDANYAIGHGAYARLDPSLHNLRVVKSYTRDPLDPSAQYHRRIDQAMLDEVGARQARAFYICGPDEMVKSSRHMLIELGIDEALIQTEIYP